VTAEKANTLRRRLSTNCPLSLRSRWFHLAKSTRNRRRASQVSRPATKGRHKLWKIRFNPNSWINTSDVCYLSRCRWIRRNLGVRLNTELQKNIVPVHHICANNRHERTMHCDNAATLSGSMTDMIASSRQPWTMRRDIRDGLRTYSFRLSIGLLLWFVEGQELTGLRSWSCSVES